MESAENGAHLVGAAGNADYQLMLGQFLNIDGQDTVFNNAVAGLSVNIKEVAAAVGYNDPLYFSKAFKNFCGVSPSNLGNE